VHDFMKTDLKELGQFDVVLYMGILYRMVEPLSAMRRVASVTAPGGLAVVATVAMEFPGLEGILLWEFLPGRELNNDPTNSCAPNAKAIDELCLAAGFREVTLLTDRPAHLQRSGRAKALGSLLSKTRMAEKLGLGEIGQVSKRRYRVYAHARHCPPPLTTVASRVIRPLSALCRQMELTGGTVGGK
jgi:hypothetical protein